MPEKKFNWGTLVIGIIIGAVAFWAISSLVLKTGAQDIDITNNPGNDALVSCLRSQVPQGTSYCIQPAPYDSMTLVLDCYKSEIEGLEPRALGDALSAALQFCAAGKPIK